MGAVSWVTRSLDIGGAHYREKHHKANATAQELAQEAHVSGHQVAKVVAIQLDGRPLLVVLPASRMISLGRIKEISEARDVRLITESEMSLLFPDCEVGAIPPFRHWNGVEIWSDRTLGTEKEILFRGGTHADAVLMPFQEWVSLVKPRVEDVSLIGDQGELGS